MVKLTSPLLFKPSITLSPSVSLCVSLCAPSLLLGFMNETDAPLWKGYFYASLMFLLSCMQSLFNHQYMYACFTVGMRVKTAVMGLVYRKVRLHSSALRCICALHSALSSENDYI